MRQESICAATAHAAVGQFLTDKDIIDNVQLRKPRWWWWAPNANPVAVNDTKKSSSYLHQLGDTYIRVCVVVAGWLAGWMDGWLDGEKVY